jgi:L-amino acid N-acyltransferase YncA
MTSRHARDVLAVYQAGSDTGNANVETVASSWQQWDADHLAAHRFVATDQHAQLLGWIVACPVSTRCLYLLRPIRRRIFPENLASLALHHRAGFRTAGRRERITNTMTAGAT